MSLITQEMCGKAVEDGPWHLKHAPDHFKTPEMCEKAVEKTHGGCAVFQIVLRLKRCVKKPLKKIPLGLEYVPDYFVHKI